MQEELPEGFRFSTAFRFLPPASRPFETTPQPRV